jgi:hypothetical protein
MIHALGIIGAIVWLGLNGLLLWYAKPSDLLWLSGSAILGVTFFGGFFWFWRSRIGSQTMLIAKQKAQQRATSRFRPTLISALRWTAGASGFFILTQSGERPQR